MDRRILWIVGLLSFTVLGFEISLMRMLSYAQWHHFAYMIISVALLGFGASGTALSLFRSFLGKHVNATIAVSGSLCVLLVAGSPRLFAVLEVDPFLLVWDLSRFWWFILFTLIALLPFFFAAMAVGISFVSFPEHSGRLYFSNLVGSGLGSFAAVVLMNFLEPSELPSAFAYGGIPAILLTIRRGMITIPVTAAVCILLMPLLPAQQLPLSQYKSLPKTLQLPEAEILDHRFSPLGVLDVVRSPYLRYAPGLSLSYTGSIPPQLGVFCDGQWLGSIPDMRDSSSVTFLRHSTLRFPYVLVGSPDVLVVGAGTGNELQLGLVYQARSLTAVEMNGALIDLLRDRYDDYTGGLFERENVRVIVSEARSFLSRDTSRYDLIVLPIPEGFDVSSGGMHALFENYLFTTEAFGAMLGRLRPGGILCVHGWMSHPPRGAAKTLAMLVGALRRAGFSDPEAHLAGVRSWGTFSMLVKSAPLTETDIRSVREYADGNGFDLIHVPGITEQEVNRFHHLDPPYLYRMMQAIDKGREEEFFESYPFYIRPATDDQPYFSHHVRWGTLSTLASLYGTRQVPFFELGYALLILTCLQLLVVSFILIPLPLFFLKKGPDVPRNRLRAFVYFGAIGFAYMAVEIVMIQRFILFLGHPIYAVATIIAVLLVSSGIGSLLSGRLISVRGSLRKILPLLVLILVLYLALLPSILGVCLPLSFPWRLMLTMLLLAVPGFLMGFPFPLGIRELSSVSPSLLPWAWGVNGYCSVMSASLAVLVGMEAGFGVLFVVAVAAYTASWITAG